MKPLPNILLSPIGKENEISSHLSENSNSLRITDEETKEGSTDTESNGSSPSLSNMKSDNHNTSNVEQNNSGTTKARSNTTKTSDTESNGSKTSSLKSNSMKSNNTNNKERTSTNTSDVRLAGERTDRKKSRKSKGVRSGNSDGVLLGAIKINIENKFLSPEEVLDLMLTHRPS